VCTYDKKLVSWLLVKKKNNSFMGWNAWAEYYPTLKIQ
jgi:hypothetical protein